MTERLETTPAQEFSQEEHNQELLRNSELGVFMERAYVEAVKQDPRLADIEIQQMDPSDTGIARAVPSWASETGKYQIMVRLDNLDQSLQRHQETLDKIPGARELLASKMGIEPDDVTPAALHVFSTLHEMGHLTEFMDYEGRPDELRLRNRREKAALPIGNATVSAIMTEGTPARELVESRWSEVQEKYDVNSIDELLELQHAAYRDMTSEKVADNFAADVFGVNPELVGALTSPNVVDEYRDYSNDVEGENAQDPDEPIEYAVKYAIDNGRTSAQLEAELEEFKGKVGGLVRSIRATAESEGRDLNDKETLKVKDIANLVGRTNEVVKRVKEEEAKAA